MIISIFEIKWELNRKILLARFFLSLMIFLKEVFKKVNLENIS